MNGLRIQIVNKLTTQAQKHWQRLHSHKLSHLNSSSSSSDLLLHLQQSESFADTVGRIDQLRNERT